MVCPGHYEYACHAMASFVSKTTRLIYPTIVLPLLDYGLGMGPSTDLSLRVRDLGRGPKESLEILRRQVLACQ